MNDRWLMGALLLLAVALGATLIATTTTSSVTFGPYNPGWNGTGEFHALAAEQGTVERLEEVEQFDGLDSERSVIVVMAPDRPYYARSGRPLRSFVERGGTVVIAGDRGRSADWLTQNLTGYRINRTPIRDLAAFREGTALPLVEPPADRPIEGVETVETNLPGSVEGAPSEQRLLVTSPTAYRDVDGDGDADPGEPMGPFTVAASQPIGDGQVIVLADPSIAIDDMIDRQDNRAFLRHLLGDADRIYVDRSHAATGRPPLIAALETLQSSPVAQIAVFGGLVVALAGLLARWRA